MGSAGKVMASNYNCEIIFTADGLDLNVIKSRMMELKCWHYIRNMRVLIGVVASI